MTVELAAGPLESPAEPAARRGKRAPRAGGSDFGPLVKRVKAAGLLEPRPWWYVVNAIVLVVMLAALPVGLVLLAGSWWALLLAPYAALVSTQLAYFGHDTAHHQVTSNRTVRLAIGLIAGNLLTGLSFGWWHDKHSRHHANPNHDGLDPDIADGLFSWSERQQHSKIGIARWFGNHQALFFFPVLTLLGWSLQWVGIRHLPDRSRRIRTLEIALLVVHVLGMVAILTWLLGPVIAICFVLVHHACWGLGMGLAFAPNHKGMAMPDGSVKLDHLRKQVLTSRNINGGVVTDYLYGGLNYQIEHHLFPAMPRPNLPRANKIISAYCAEVGIPYRSCGVVESYAECLHHLRIAGRD